VDLELPVRRAGRGVVGGDVGPAVTIPNAVAALGMLAMVAGFGLSALAMLRGRAAGDPAA